MKHLIVVPKAGSDYAFALLEGGACGSRPPLAALARGVWHANAGTQLDQGLRRNWLDNETLLGGAPSPVGLVLVWDGAPVPEGMDRLCRATFATFAIHLTGEWRPTVLEAEALANLAVAGNMAQNLSVVSVPRDGS